jgi:seryl-tRNA synthetase
MLDIQFIREYPDTVRKACENKQLDSSVVDELLEADEARRALQQQVDELRRQSNEHSEAVKQTVQDEGKPNPEQIETGKEIKTKLKAVEPDLRQAEDRYHELMLQIPNVPVPGVPVGEDESGNEAVRHEGTKPEFEFEPRPHHELMEELDLLDIERAVRVGGFRSYFLKNEGLLLEQAILQYALQKLIKYGFTPMSAPILVNEDALVGTGYFPWGKEDHYKTQDDQRLAGTSEVALTSYHQGELLREDDLPIKLCGISPCYRREVGSHGKDTQGIFRVHQFNKVEQVVYTIADEDETSDWHERMLGFSEELLQDLGLHYRVLLMCTGDMGSPQRKKYDIETWFPAQQRYRETHSASYFNDFQSRRLDIRYQAKDGTTKYVYTLNNTMAATPRLLAAVIENYQRADGSIAVPKVLQKWVGESEVGA